MNTKPLLLTALLTLPAFGQAWTIPGDLTAIPKRLELQPGEKVREFNENNTPTTHPSTKAGTGNKSSLGLPATPVPSNPTSSSYNSNTRSGGRGCGSRGGPGYRKANGKCASWKD